MAQVLAHHGHHGSGQCAGQTDAGRHCEGRRPATAAAPFRALCGGLGKTIAGGAGSAAYKRNSNDCGRSLIHRDLFVVVFFCIEMAFANGVLDIGGFEMYSNTEMYAYWTQHTLKPKHSRFGSNINTSLHIVHIQNDETMRERESILMIFKRIVST